MHAANNPTNGTGEFEKKSRIGMGSNGDPFGDCKISFFPVWDAPNDTRLDGQAARGYVLLQT